jgi:hypothetical protein
MNGASDNSAAPFKLAAGSRPNPILIAGAVRPKPSSAPCAPASPPPSRGMRAGGTVRARARIPSLSTSMPAALRPSPRDPAAALQRALRPGFTSAVPRHAGGTAPLRAAELLAAASQGNRCVTRKRRAAVREQISAVPTESRQSAAAVQRALRSGFASAVPQHAGGMLPLKSRADPPALATEPGQSRLTSQRALRPASQPPFRSARGAARRLSFRTTTRVADDALVQWFTTKQLRSQPRPLRSLRSCRVTSG